MLKVLALHMIQASLQVMLEYKMGLLWIIPKCLCLVFHLCPCLAIHNQCLFRCLCLVIPLVLFPLNMLLVPLTTSKVLIISSPNAKENVFPLVFSLPHSLCMVQIILRIFSLLHSILVQPIIFLKFVKFVIRKVIQLSIASRMGVKYVIGNDILQLLVLTGMLPYNFIWLVLLHNFIWLVLPLIRWLFIHLLSFFLLALHLAIIPLDLKFSNLFHIKLFSL